MYNGPKDKNNRVGIDWEGWGEVDRTGESNGREKLGQL